LGKTNPAFLFCEKNKGVVDYVMLKSAVWFITWKCNFRCPYCWEVQRARHGQIKHEDFLPSDKLAEAWNRLKPEVLDISGGEPFLQPNFIDLLEGLQNGITVAITTNLAFDMTQFVQRITPLKVFSMTLSYHPSQNLSFEQFLGRALMLKNRGFTLTVNFVGYPEQMWLAESVKQKIEAAGLRWHFDPYSQTEFYPYKYTPDEEALLKGQTGTDRQNAFVTVKRPVICSAGFDHVTVFPDGKVYRCINDKIMGLPPVGDLLDPTLKLNDRMTLCGDYNTCAGCNRDKVKVEDV